ncbi:phosphoribosyltransferase [Quadrisphaera sp. DSM 44207]|uniref:phosphoribosyltransferase n=1 Tax=Quadrisphaera sp. DSM 44207 TaxID=1881057 RepID=UPI000888FDC6|nr:phosphoribosyltransferase family protein [Quadrisphaera sp. DSM 44207]SDQ34399.1 Predicted phosphoribosyltransferase [Quadrisphaera sp. DSM 44207]
MGRWEGGRSSGSVYPDRREAGRVLAEAVRAAVGAPPGAAAGCAVLGLPRGGVPVAAPVAEALGGDLDVLVVRKLGVPEQPELAMGAVAVVGSALETVRNERVLAHLGIAPEVFEAVRDREVAELGRREAAYRAGRAAVPVRGRTVVLVDDGLATGATVRAAVAAVRRQGPSRVVVAVPVGSARTCEALAEVADEVVCPWTPEPFAAVGQAYRDFAAVPDERVRELLSGASGSRRRAWP